MLPLCRVCGVRQVAPSYFRKRGNYRCSTCYLREAEKRRKAKWDSGYRPTCKVHRGKAVTEATYVNYGRLRCTQCIYREGNGKGRAQSLYRRNTAFVRDYKKAHPCVDCGESDWRCLDFDHRENKQFALSDVSSQSIEAITAEIAKCDLRCANCHRKRHLAERGLTA